MNYYYINNLSYLCLILINQNPNNKPVQVIECSGFGFFILSYLLLVSSDFRS